MNWRTFRTPAFLLALTLLVLSSLGMGAAIRHYRLQLRKLPIYPPPGHALRDLPERAGPAGKAGEWVKIGPDRVEEGEVLETLGTSNYLTRTYGRVREKAGGELEIDPGSVIEFHTAYYTGMVDTVPHVPDRCFVAGGMQLAGLTRDVPLPLNQEKWRVDKYLEGPLVGHQFYTHSTKGNKANLPRDPQKLELHCTKFITRAHDLYAGYFFIANGGAVARAEEVRLLAFDLHSRYAYYLKVQFTSGNVKSEDELAALAASFLDETFGDLMECVPDWVEVEAGNYPPDNPAKKSQDKQS
jgi:hypothetical protein